MIRLYTFFIGLLLGYTAPATAHTGDFEITMGARLIKSPGGEYNLKFVHQANAAGIPLVSPSNPYSIQLQKLLLERVEAIHQPAIEKILVALSSFGPSEDWNAIYKTDIALTETPDQTEYLATVFNHKTRMPNTIENRYAWVSVREQVFLNLYGALHAYAVEEKLAHPNSDAIDNLMIEVLRETPNQAAFNRAWFRFLNPT